MNEQTLIQDALKHLAEFEYDRHPVSADHLAGELPPKRGRPVTEYAGVGRGAWFTSRTSRRSGTPSPACASTPATGRARRSRAEGWTTLTAICLMLFSLCHNPCSTTIFTIWEETRSAKWTALATFLPIGIGVILCGLIAFVWRILT